MASSVSPALPVGFWSRATGRTPVSGAGSRRWRATIVALIALAALWALGRVLDWFLDGPGQAMIWSAVRTVFFGGVVLVVIFVIRALLSEPPKQPKPEQPPAPPPRRKSSLDAFRDRD